MYAEIAKEQIRRKGLEHFVRVFWNTVESAEYVEERHIQIVCRHLEACAFRATASLKRQQQPWMEGLEEIKDLVIAIPPGMSKSLTAMVFFPAWVWSWCPAAKFLCTSYSETLAHRDGKRSFELMSSDLYKSMYPDVDIVGGERASMTFYTNSKKGLRFSTALGSSATGFHAHLLIADDPTKPADLELGGESAAAALEKVRGRWDDTFSSRSAHPATFTRIVIAQRLAVEDLSGTMIDRGATHLFLPMEHVPERSYRSPWGDDWRTAEGELLAPLRFPEEVVSGRKRWLSARTYSAQYQQDPTPADGSIFKREWFAYRYPFGTYPWGQSPIFLSVDCSLKETSKSDFTVIQAWSKVGPKYYLVDQIRERMGFAKQVQAIMTMRSKYANVRNILVEAKANGDSVIQTLQKQFSGVIAVNPQGGKESRAAATEWLWNSGCVWLPEGAPWLDQFVEEHLTFPVGRNDDSVDSATQALIWASARDRAQLFKAAMSHQAKNLRVGRSPF